MPLVFRRRLGTLATVLCSLCACGLIAAAVAPPASAASPVLAANAPQGTLAGWGVQVIADGSVAGGQAVKYASNGSVAFHLKLPADADTLTLGLRADQCAGAPTFTVTVDGLTVATGTATSSSWTTASISHFLPGGTHVVTVAATNAGWVGSGLCTRALYLGNLVLSASSHLVAPAAPSIPAGFVHQSGTQVLDGANRPLKLHGVDLGGWLNWQGWIWGQGFDYIGESAMMANLTSLVGQTAADQFQSEVYANYITAGDFHAIAEDGLNVVRLPFNYRLLEDDTNPFVYKASGWAVLDQAISEAAANNVYVVLDMEVAPCSQTMGFTADYTGGPLLWNSSQCQARTVAMWKAIAQRYANQNIIAGYDLLNESVASNQQLLSMYEQITAAIRQVDPNHMIVYEGNNLARDFSLFTSPLDRNEMLEFHDYAWENGDATLASRMPGYDATARALDAPQWAGEFGQDPYSTISQYVSTFANDPLIAGYADWTYKQAPEFPALQTLQLSPAAQMLILWMNNPSRPEPTLAQAQQGMSDFITDIQFGNTLPDAQMAEILSGEGSAVANVAGTGAVSTSPGPSSSALKTTAADYAAVSHRRAAKSAKSAKSKARKRAAQKHKPARRRSARHPRTWRRRSTRRTQSL